MPEPRRISKSGNSAVVVLPRKFLKALSLRVGDVVLVDLVKDMIVLSKLEAGRQARLLAEINDARG
jgi:antitoxin component of MazEF toxin-antitoxin module